ncbi:MAG: hypothetical protein ACLPIC_21050 [Rhodoblastus sp.]|uniref:hypothetical protein n=1 Tax=Rhodoblastus sp. TaxID=1962975 RepID=UPI003F96D919
MAELDSQTIERVQPAIGAGFSYSITSGVGGAVARMSTAAKKCAEVFWLRGRVEWRLAADSVL